MENPIGLDFEENRKPNAKPCKIKSANRNEQSDPIRSDPTNPDFVDAALFTSHKGILGYFRSF